MISRVSVCYWVFAVFILYQFDFGSARVENLWCLQCSWSRTQDYYSLNGTNSTGDPLCSIVNLDDITVFGPNPTTPIVNPMCTYPDSSAYSELLKGPCYDYACYALTGKSCVKWSVYSSNGNLLNVSRLCAVVDYKSGCYTQDYGGGYTKEVCICNDQQFCNTGWTLHRQSQQLPRIWLCVVTSLLIWRLAGIVTHL